MKLEIIFWLFELGGLYSHLHTPAFPSLSLSPNMPLPSPLPLSSTDSSTVSNLQQQQRQLLTESGYTGVQLHLIRQAILSHESLGSNSLKTCFLLTG